MQGKYKIWLFVFAILTIINLTAEFLHQQNLIYFTKPLLLTVLSFYFYQSTKHQTSSFSRYILLGLIFSIAGDSFLMFVESNPEQQLFFLLGLASFLLTHIFYFTAFFNFPSKIKSWIAQRPWILLFFLAYLIGNTVFLWKDIPNDLRIPVVLYSSCILLMTIACLNLIGKIPKAVFQIIFLGVLLFVISDTIIGLNKFKSTQFAIPYPRLMIMIPYLLGQFFITKAAVQMNALIK